MAVVVSFIDIILILLLPAKALSKHYHYIWLKVLQSKKIMKKN